MSLIATAVKHMMAAGMDSDAICAAVSEMEAQIDARSPGAKRQERYRDRHKASQSVTSDVGDTEPLSPSPNEINSNPHPHTREDIPAREPLEVLFEVVDAIAQDIRKKLPPPVGVEKGQWQAFRKQRKKALTDRAYLMICNKLSVLAEAGWPPGDMIDLATERGWETVFEPKDGSNGQGNRGGNGYGPKADPTLALVRSAVQAQRQDGRDHRETGFALPPGQYG